jgi:hypothetical protein
VLDPIRSDPGRERRANATLLDHVTQGLPGREVHTSAFLTAERGAACASRLALDPNRDSYAGLRW